MPKENQQGQDKTESPTSKRLSEARSNGQVAKSQELNSAAVLLAGIVALVSFGGFIYNRLTGFMVTTFMQLGDVTVDPSNIRGGIGSVALWLLITLAPLFIIIPISALIAHRIQFKFLWSTKALKPKFDKMNPIKGLKNLFKQQNFVRMVLNLIKVFLFGFIGYLVVKSDWEHFVPLMDADVATIFVFLVQKALKIAYWFLAIMLLLGIIDFAYQKYKHIEGLKMSKQEVKDERKMREGDPKVKSQIRQAQMRIAFSRMIRELPSADVVVTNPVHVAVAMKYNPDEMAAPILVGKGLRKLAERIKSIAREQDIPIVENPPLARAIYKSVDVGEEIPGQFYQDVAEILAQIYQLQGDSEFVESSS